MADRQPSPASDVQAMYDETALDYAAMMDAEIRRPIYADTLSRLAQRIASVPGPVVDVACGSGHMLALFHDRYDVERSLVGIDLSPAMVATARARLGSHATIVTGDMGDLSPLSTGKAAALINFFAIHHVDPTAVPAALAEWSRVLHAGGQLLLAAWVGEGEIDYGDAAELVALNHAAPQVVGWVESAGFVVDCQWVEREAEIGLDALYLEASKR